ncbi:MAG: MlaC/ttg2D family ABC transporter substrate-binding protein [Polyangiales bacterium]
MLRSIRRSLFAALLAVSAVSAATVVESASYAADGAATSFVQGKTDKLRQLLATPASAEREKKIDEELKGLIDFDLMAKSSLGYGTEHDYYTPRTKEEIADFTDVLKKLVEKNYKKNLNDTLNFDVSFVGEEAQKDGDVVVKSLAKSKTDPKKPANKIDYRLKKRDKGYVVVDLITEESPMVNTFRKDFRKKIDKDGFPALMTQLKKKLATP